MPLTQVKTYNTEEDYYNLPENVRAKLINNVLIYNQAAPSRVHQTIVMELSATIREYIKSKGGFCRVYPAPFAVTLRKDTIVDPRSQSILVYRLEQEDLTPETYIFQNKVKVGIYEDLCIDFSELEL